MLKKRNVCSILALSSNYATKENTVILDKSVCLLGTLLPLL